MHQHVARAARAAAVTAVGLTAVDVHTIGVGHAHAQALRTQQVGGQAHSGGFAVGTCHGNDRDAAVFAVGEHQVDDGLPHVTAFAVGRIEVHAQTWRRVHLDDATALFFERAQYRFADHIHTADVQTHHARGRYGACGDLGVDIVGHIGGSAPRGQVGVVAKDDATAFFGHGVRL